MANDFVVKGREIIKGATINKNFNNNLLYDAMPWQMVNLEDKTSEWKEWNADYFEWIGLREVDNKYKRIIKNRMLASGILDMEDYTIGNEGQSYLNSLISKEETPLKKFYPLIPPFINVLHGEFIKRDIKVFVTCIDRETQDEKLQYKTDMLNKILIEAALKRKQQALAEMGIQPVNPEQLQEMTPEQQQQAQEINERYVQEMETERKIVETERKYKKYRHALEEFGQIVLNRDITRFSMEEKIVEAFIESICNAEVAFHLDMLEDDYVPEFIDNALTFSHKSDSVKYYSEGDYFGWFEYMSVGDIINRHGRRLKEEDFKVLQESVKNFADSNFSSVGLIPDQFRNQPGMYYDTSKPYPKGKTDLAKYQFLQNETISDILTNTTLSSDQLAYIYGNQSKTKSITPKLFRVMRCYFRSQRKIGWLIRKNKAGQITFQGWVDENYKVTEKPIYDFSLTKDKTEENLVYGEHIDWTWTNEWRHVIKINLNNDHPYWKKQEMGENFKPIYIDGDPIQYNFTGKSASPFEVHPPFEGTQYKMKGVRPVSMVETLSGFQIWANIAFNKIPDIMFDDIGLALAINKATIPLNNPGMESAGDPLENSMENLRVNKVFDFTVDREIIREQGNAAPLVPQVLNLSRIQEGLQYKQLLSELKTEAGEVIGISRQRLAQAKASESATQTQAGINYSETQTEYFFDRFSNEFMPRIYQKMIEAAMYYASISGTARAAYQTSEEGNVLLELEDLQGTFRQYLVTCQYNSRIKEVQQKLETLFMNNNTTGTHMYDLALGVSESNPATIMENLRKSKAKMEQQQEEEAQRQQQMQQQAEEAATQRQRELFEHQENIQRMRDESQERQAMIRALGGLQSDNDKDGQLDAYENLQLHIQQMQNSIQNQMGQSTLDFKKKQHQDNMDYQNRALSVKESIEQKKLAAALANQNSKDDKALNKQIAKKQGVS